MRPNLARDRKHGVAPHGRVHGNGLGILHRPRASVTLGSRYNIEKSKSGHFELEFEGPARVFKLEGDTHEIATAFDSSVTEGGVRGKSCAVRPLRGSVILESVVPRIRFLSRNEASERPWAQWAHTQHAQESGLARS